MAKSFKVDGILYTHPWHTASVYIRPMIQLLEFDAKLSPMKVIGNSPKAGLMDSEVDEERVRRYWED